MNISLENVTVVTNVTSLDLDVTTVSENLLRENVSANRLRENFNAVGLFKDTNVFGKHEFVQSRPWTAIPTIVILSIASFVGTGGNIMILLAIASSHNLRNVEAIFIVNLAISDLYVTLIADPMSIVGKFHFCIFCFTLHLMEEPVLYLDYYVQYHCRYKH